MRKTMGVVALVGLLAGCGIIVPLQHGEDRLAKLQPGMDRTKVAQVMGGPGVVRGSTYIGHGLTQTLVEYRLYPDPGRTAAANAFVGLLALTLWWWVPPQTPTPYWLQFVSLTNAKGPALTLEQWGEAGDWQPDRTIDLTMHSERR